MRERAFPREPQLHERRIDIGERHYDYYSHSGREEIVRYRDLTELSAGMVSSGLDDVRTRTHAPADVYLLASAQARPFHLDTAQAVDGVVFTDGVITLRRDGSIDQGQADPREFHRRAAPFAFDRPTFEAARDADAVEWPALERAPAPYTAFLGQLFGDAADGWQRAELLSQLIGYTLTTERGAQIIVLLVGAGRSGKSSVLRLVTELLGGDDAVVAANSVGHLGGRFTLGRARGRAALTIDDMEQRPNFGHERSKYDQGAALLKAISGEGSLTVEVKGIQPGDAAPLNLQVWAAGNAAPRFIRGADDALAWTERMQPIKFDRPVPAAKRREGLAQRMVAEHGAGIAAYCLGRFARAWSQSHHLNTQTFIEPPSTRALLADMRNEAIGPADGFIEEHAAFSGLDGGFTERKQVKEAYRDYVRQQTGEGGFEPSNQAMSAVYKLLDAHFAANPADGKPHKRDGHLGWLGLTLTFS